VGLVRLLTVPIRSIARSRLVQLAAVVAIIVLLQAANDNSLPGQISNFLDALVSGTLQFISGLFRLKTFTRSVLTVGLMIVYVYLACLLILLAARFALRAMIDFIGRNNVLYLRNTIARERGIAAYRAWEPFERIRPRDIPQEKWEAAFAWPRDDKPPYPPLPQRVARATLGYVIVIVAAAVLLQVFTPFPVLTWLASIV
jgi:hypothetical protein